MSTGMRLLVILNFLGAVASTLLLASTWFAKGVIVHQAQNIALEKTRSFLAPAVSGAEKLLDQPLVAKTFPPSVKTKLAGEIASYKTTPDEWLLEIANSTRDRAHEFDFPEVRNPLARKSLDFVTSRLAGARNHFKNSFDNLIRDLRIFSAVNLLIFLTAGGLCFIARTPRSRRLLVAWSAVLFTATAISIFLYADQGWVWNILTNHYRGWAYLAGHLVTTAYIATKLLGCVNADGTKTETDKPQQS